MNDVIDKKEMLDCSNSIEEVKQTSVRYGCELIKHKASFIELKAKNIPNDTFIVKYLIDNEIFYDLCRGKKMVDIFDLYYDMLGKNNIISIDFGYGVVNPKNWNLENTKKETRKRRK